MKGSTEPHRRSYHRMSIVTLAAHIVAHRQLIIQTREWLEHLVELHGIMVEVYKKRRENVTSEADPAIRDSKTKQKKRTKR